MSTPHRVDVHYHVIPKPYVERLNARGIHGSTGVDFPKWSVAHALRDLDRTGVATAVTSLSSPGVQFGDRELGRQLARICNDFQARMASDHPERFRSFAFLPLPDVDGALVELEHALDGLGHDGVVLLTDTEGRYLGDPDYEELFAELDRRRAVVFVHPHTEPGRERSYPILHPLLEWPVHTTRAVMDLLFSGRLARYPNIRYILAHGGGTMPILARRIVAWPGADGAEPPDAGERAERLRLLRTLYLDTASPGEAHLAALQAFAAPGHLVFGTDGGWTMSIQVGFTIKTLLTYGFDADALAALEQHNASALFPRLRAAA
jgi:predicted TIM-barrel fold metal-dependent hydrolase